MAVLFLVGGLVLLILGARLLVGGASRLAQAAGISPLMIGLTVVAFGTSAPELTVSVAAAGAGSGSIALGNVVGSNIFNVLFVLGASAAILPLVVARQLVRFEVPMMIAASVAIYALAYDGRVSRIDGVLLALAFLLFIAWSYRIGRREADGVLGVPSAVRRGWPMHVVVVVLGLALLVLGARWLVNAAVELARALGVSELVVGLTIVAAGTSLPEAATSVVAALRGERDIAVGNVIGSNLFNVFAVLGLAALVAPDGIGVAAAALNFDIPVMMAAAVACLPIFFTAHRIDRWEGLLFLGYYLAYTGYTLLDATGHDAQEPFGAVMLWFVMPLTAVTLAVLALRALQRAGRIPG